MCVQRKIGVGLNFRRVCQIEKILAVEPRCIHQGCKQSWRRLSAAIAALEVWLIKCRLSDRPWNPSERAFLGCSRSRSLSELSLSLVFALAVVAV